MGCDEKVEIAFILRKHISGGRHLMFKDLPG
jgi:hypothetical protein